MRDLSGREAARAGMSVMADPGSIADRWDFFGLWLQVEATTGTVG